MDPGHVLVIAPELDLRLSIEFLLETEGHSVVTRPRIDFPGSASDRFSCTVLDHKAIVGPTDRIIEFCQQAGPVVLLTYRPISWLDFHVSSSVQKPLFGSDLAVAVRRAIDDATLQHH